MAELDQTISYQQQLAEQIIYPLSELVILIREHQNRQHFLQLQNETFEKLKEYFEQFGDLLIILQEGAVTFRDKLLIPSEKTLFWIYMDLFHAGITKLLILTDLTVDELERFLFTLADGNQDLKQLSITLWECRFYSILYDRKRSGTSFTDIQINSRKELLEQLNTQRHPDIRQIREQLTGLPPEDQVISFEENQELLNAIYPSSITLVDILNDQEKKLTFSSREVIDIWAEMLLDFASYFIESDYQKYIKYASRSLRNNTGEHVFYALYTLFERLKKRFENSNHKNQIALLIKSFYKELLQGSYFNRLLYLLASFPPEVMDDLYYFLKQMNKSALTLLLEKFSLIEDRPTRRKTISFFKELKFDLKGYYLFLIKQPNSEDVVEGIEGIDEMPISWEEKYKLYRKLFKRREPPVVIKLFTIFKNHLDDDLFKYFIAQLTQENEIILRQLLIFLKNIEQEKLLIKVVKFVETDHFLNWSPDLQREFLRMLTQKIGSHIKNYLLVLFDQWEKDKERRHQQRLAIIYALSFTKDPKVYEFIKGLSKKLMGDRTIKQEASAAIKRMDNHGF